MRRRRSKCRWYESACYYFNWRIVEGKKRLVGFCKVFNIYFCVLKKKKRRRREEGEVKKEIEEVGERKER